MASGFYSLTIITCPLLLVFANGKSSTGLAITRIASRLHLRKLSKNLFTSVLFYFSGRL
jgi:hypothetical protein